MAFKMRSGNKVSFKNMGSSPAKDMKTGSYEHSFESPAKQGYTPHKEETHEEKLARVRKKEEEAQPGKGYTPHVPETHKEKLERVRKEKMENKPRQGVSDTTPKTPAKQKLNKGGEGQDQDKIFNDQGDHIGDYVNGKKVMKSTSWDEGLDPEMRAQLDKVIPGKKSTKKRSQVMKDGEEIQKFIKKNQKKSPAKQSTRDQNNPGDNNSGQQYPKREKRDQNNPGDNGSGQQYPKRKKRDEPKTFGNSPTKQYDHSEDVKTNIKNQSKRDKISNDAKKAASVLDGTSEKVATNTELKEQNKSYKQDQRGVDTPGGRRRTRSERIEAKDSDLELRGIAAEDNEARGEGKRGFSWKNAGMAALEGQGLMGAVRSGIGTGDYKSTTIKRKQTKRAGKAERKVTKATQKENRVAKRAARRNKVRNASDLSTEI